MPVNRFDVLPGQKYISTYTPLPYAELADIAAKYQHKSDTNKMIPYEFDKLASSLEAAPYHQNYKDQVIGKYKGAINELVNNTKDFASPDFQAKAMNIVSSFKNDKDVQTIQGEAKAFKKYEDSYALDPKNQRDLNFSLPDGQISEGHLIKHGLNIVPYANHVKDAASYTEHMIADKKPGSYIKPYKDGFMYETVNGSTEYITKDRLQNDAADQVQSYAGTEGGNFRMKEFIAKQLPQLAPKLSNMNYDQITEVLGEEGKKSIDTYLANDIIAQGLQKVHTKREATIGLHNDSIGYDQSKQEQSASTTPESISLTDKGTMRDVMPEGLSKFYNKDGTHNITGSMESGTKEAGDRIGKMAGFVNLDLLANKSTNIDKNAAQYADQLFETASKIMGTSRKEVANQYNEPGKGLNWLKGVVENHYSNIALQKNTVATLQEAEQVTASKFFIGDKDRAMHNLGAAEITDLQGNLVDKTELIDNIRNKDNDQGLHVRSIGFDKPGQIVISDKNGNSYYANTNYETLKKLTKPAVEINKGAESYLKDFKLSDSQKSNLGIKGTSEAPKFTVDYNGKQISGEAIDRHVYKTQDNTIDAISIVSRSLTGDPLPFVNLITYDKDGKMVGNSTMTLEDYKSFTGNTILQNSEFRGLNKQKENKVSFDTNIGE